MNDGIKLTNPEFTLSLGGRDFQVRKANLEKAIQYQAKVKELLEAKDAQADLKLVSYCTWLIIKDVDPSLTEDWVRANLPGDLDTMDMLATLGFMSQQKVEIAKRVQNALAQKSPEETTETKA